MKKVFKRMLSWVLVLTLVISMLPASVFAAETEEEAASLSSVEEEMETEVSEPISEVEETIPEEPVTEQVVSEVSEETAEETISEPEAEGEVPAAESDEAIPAVTEEAESVESSVSERKYFGAFTHINPLYENEISENDLVKLSEAQVLNSEISSEAERLDATYTTMSAAGAYMRDRMVARASTFSLYLRMSTLTQNSVNAAVDKMLDYAVMHTGNPDEGDYLRWHWEYVSANIYYYDNYDGTYDVQFVFSATYYTTAAQEAEMNTAVNNLLNSLNLSGKTNYQRIKAVYDWVCSNVTYDHYSSGMYKHTAHAALISRTAVCQGYASLIYRLALEMGIDCRVVAGTNLSGDAHGWNIIKLGNYYYNLDATWDSDYMTYYGYYKYFLQNPAGFSDHLRWEEYNTTAFHSKYPMGSTDYDPNTATDGTGGVTVPSKPYKIVNTVSGVHVYWNSISGIAKYGVYRSESGADGTYKWIANPTTNHFTDTSVTSGKTYYYKITTVDTLSNTHSSKSEALGITYVATPDITSRINKGAGIQVGWDKITGATGYAIYRKSYSGSDAWVRVKTITGNSTFTWIDTSVKNNNGTIYRYTVRALAGSNMSTLSGCRNTGRTMVRLCSRTLTSATKSTVTYSESLLNADVLDTSYTPSSTVTTKAGIKCKWTTSSAVTGYEVRFMVGSSVYKTYTIGNYNTGTKTFTGLPTGKTYKIQVRSYKKVSGVGSFYSAWSTEKYVTL